MLITSTNRWENNFYNILYWLRHVYKQMQDDNIDEVHFAIIRVPIWKNVPPSEDQKLEQIEQCIVGVPIRPSEQ